MRHMHEFLFDLKRWKAASMSSVRAHKVYKYFRGFRSFAFSLSLHFLLFQKLCMIIWWLLSRFCVKLKIFEVQQEAQNGEKISERSQRTLVDPFDNCLTKVWCALLSLESTPVSTCFLCLRSKKTSQADYIMWSLAIFLIPENHVYHYHELVASSKNDMIDLILFPPKKMPACTEMILRRREND
jgi:hypothetical protein